MKKDEFRREVDTMRAPQKEVDDVVALAQVLAGAPRPQRSAAVKQTRLQAILARPVPPAATLWHRRLGVSLVGLVTILFALAFGTLVHAQQSIPGESLYTVKRWSEGVASTIWPDFKSTLPVRRSAEVQALVKQQRQDVALLQETLADYQEEVHTMQERSLAPTPHLAESITILEEAKENASSEGKQEIEAAIEAVTGGGEGTTNGSGSPTGNDAEGTLPPPTIIQPLDAPPPPTAFPDNEITPL